MTVIPLNTLTTCDIPCNDVLEGAKDVVSDVIVLGYDENNELYVASHKSDIAELNLLLDIAKQFLLQQTTTIE